MRKYLLPLLGLLLWAIPAGAQITVLQSALGTANQADPSATVTIAGVTAHSLLVACWTLENANGKTFTYTDAQGSYSVADNSTEGAASRQTYLVYLPNANAGSHTLTVAWTGTLGAINDLNIIEVSGIATSTPLDAHGHFNTGTTTTGDQPIGTLSTQAQTAELFVGCGRSSSSSTTWTVGSDFTTLIKNHVGDGMEYRVVSSDLHPFTGHMATANSGFAYSGSIASFLGTSTPPASKIVGPSKIAGPTKTD